MRKKRKQGSKIGQKSGQRPQEVSRLPQFSLYSNNTKRRGRICAISYGTRKKWRDRSHAINFIKICLPLLFAKSVSEYERILSFTMLGIKKPLVVSLAQRLITVLFVTPIFLLSSMGVNSYIRFLRRSANKRILSNFHFSIFPIFISLFKEGK